MFYVHSDATLRAFESHPDFNTVSAFFLGCVFAVAFQCIIFATLTQRCARLVTRRRTLNSVNDVEGISDRCKPTNGGIRERENTLHILLFAMFLAFSLGSISDLVSLTSGRLEALCAFTVSWGLMATKFARLLGLIMLLMTTYRLHILPRWELITVIFWFLSIFVLILVDGALNTGTVKVAEYLGMSFCVRRRVLPASLAPSILYIVLELYFITRLAMVLLSRLSHQRGPPVIVLLRDTHLQRACSLLFFELLVVVPSAGPVNKIGFFVPTTLGSLVVLAVFSSKTRTAEMEKVTPDRRSFTFSEKLPASPIRITASQFPPTIETSSAISHRYSSASLSNPALSRAEDFAPPTSKSSTTFKPSRASSFRSQRTAQLAHPSPSLYPFRIPLPADMPNAVPRQLSVKGRISRKGRPKLSVVTHFPAYNPNNANPTRGITYNGTEGFNDGGLAVEMGYEFYSNAPHTAPLRGRFSPPSSSDLKYPRAPYIVIPQAESAVPALPEDPPPIATFAGSQTRTIPHNSGFRPKGPRSRSGNPLMSNS
ncbi:hypothetical protein E1B28_004328 [Marasmius oreades]|uniref:Uncharacterized protein n=1 Tax=Marasmius oreades TaxID=181124 RepID=A0A9P8ACU8_9AGAR|nr:uncharacterized protein E1B28_004328 [Marasmius oreades]KAG7096927.1 hypothetical protein E1B28_004328 [Marasmius oreades]